MTQDVFLSYSRVDLPFIEQLDSFLTSVGLATWFDRKSLLPGQKWDDAIDDEISRSRTFLTCLSKSGLQKKGFFHVEQHRASEAALRIPPDELFILPVALGDCEIPRALRQYHVVNLVEPGAISMLLLSLSTALDRRFIADPLQVEKLYRTLIAHLGEEGLSNENFIEKFDKTDELSFQSSMGIIERIANSNDPKRLTILLAFRARPDISYAEEAALDIAIDNAKAGNKTDKLQETVKAAELTRIANMEIPGNADATETLRMNKYFRYISRKNTEPYRMAEAKILELIREHLRNRNF
ncbi:TIR domain-containing protein [Burkholderia sp. CF099]|nr:TIR domain-containing protein [Burkholderia sp. CF099]